MKERIKGFLSGVILTSLLSCSVVFAEDVTKTVDVVYSNIKIFIDGAEYVAKDANGNVVEPFVYNGTTYLPVRGIANAFQKDVVWDGVNASIYLGKKDQNQPDNWLDRIQYSYFGKGRNTDNLWKINGKITDHLKNDYNNGMLFWVDYSGDRIKDDVDNANTLIDYPLNSQYKKLSGKIVLPQKINIAGCEKYDDETRDGQTVNITFYGDDKKIYQANSVTTTMPFIFDINVQGVNKLTAKISVNNGYYTFVALTDLALYK